MKNKIAIVLPNLSLIGAQRVAIDYGNELTERGYEVTFLIKQSLYNLSDLRGQKLVIFQGSVFKSLKFLRYLESVMILIKFIKKNKFDCVISVTPNFNRLLCFFKLLRLIDSKLIIEDHACPPDSYDDEFGKGLIRKWYELSEIFYRCADIMRVLSDESYAHYKSRHPGLKIIVQQNMMDLIRIREASYIQPSISPKKSFIFYVGRMVRQKDISFLINAFKEAAELIDDDLIIVGYGPLKDKLIKQARSSSVSERIHFLENSNSNYWYMKNASLFPMTSIWEGHPLTMIEAMVLGTPVISLGFNAGPKHLIGSNERGIIVGERSQSRFAKEIVGLIKDPAKSSELSIAAARFVNLEIDIKKNFHKYINLFLR